MSGIALVLILYYMSTLFRRKQPDMACLDKLASFLFYMLIIDLSLETLDFIHRLYESEESIGILSSLIVNKLRVSLVVVQILLGTVTPLVLLAISRFAQLPPELKRLGYIIAALLVQVGIFTTRWNVVIGGQLFSKSLRGLTQYKMELGGCRGSLHRHRALRAAVRHPVRAGQAASAVDRRGSGATVPILAC